MVLLKEIETEWRAQIEKVKEIIKPRVLRAIDGHIHIHMPSFLFDLAARLAREYSIPEIRIVAEPFYISSKFSECFSKTFIINIVKRWVLAVFGHYNIRIAKKYGLKHPDAMIGVLYSGIISKANIKSGIIAAENRGKKRIEVLMHIGRAEESELSRWQGNHSKAGFVLNHNRDLEYADLVLLRKNNNG